MEYTRRYASPLGAMLMASDGEALTGLWFDGQAYFAQTLDAAHTEKALPVFEETARWLDDYFRGRAPDFTPPLRMKTTAFRRRVWSLLLQIPYGETVTYGQLAALLGTPRVCAQAVGGAVAHNAVSLIIPCHRVIGADGSLTGYAGGIEKKRRLLAMEQAGK